MNFEILLATSNPHKLQEVREILSPHGIIVYGINDLNLHPEEVLEDGQTYFDNALIKAKSMQKLTKLPIIADDSGLEIHALNNEPGLYSARYAALHGGHEQAIKDILKRLEGKERSAEFVCSICLVNLEDKPLCFEAHVPGHIALSPFGEGGFGYDPIFVEESSGKTYAELSQEEKNKLSHRGRALYKLLTYLRINHLTNR